MRLELYKLTKICRCSKPNFRILENAFHGSLVHTIHFCIASLSSQACDQKCSLLFVEEARFLGPVYDPKLREQAQDNRHDSFNDEYLKMRDIKSVRISYRVRPELFLPNASRYSPQCRPVRSVLVSHPS
jgi:hypothetical protein